MIEIIGVPQRTGLRVITRHARAWAVWTGVDNLQDPPAMWTGVYIELHDNGLAYSVVVQPDFTENRMRIK